MTTYIQQLAAMNALEYTPVPNEFREAYNAAIQEFHQACAAAQKLVGKKGSRDKYEALMKKPREALLTIGRAASDKYPNLFPYPISFMEHRLRDLQAFGYRIGEEPAVGYPGIWPMEVNTIRVIAMTTPAVDGIYTQDTLLVPIDLDRPFFGDPLARLYLSFDGMSYSDSIRRSIQAYTNTSHGFGERPIRKHRELARKMLGAIEKEIPGFTVKGGYVDQKIPLRRRHGEQLAMIA